MEEQLQEEDQLSNMQALHHELHHLSQQDPARKAVWEHPSLLLEQKDPRMAHATL